MPIKSDTPHMIEAGLQPSIDSWFYPQCTCGWAFTGPLPDTVTSIDALMAHAFEMGFYTGKGIKEVEDFKGS